MEDLEEMKKRIVDGIVNSGLNINTFPSLRNTNNLNQLKEFIVDNIFLFMYLDIPLFDDNYDCLNYKFDVINNKVNGKFVKLWENGKVEYIYNVIDNFFEGDYFYYYDTGIIANHSTFKKNKRNGLCKSYHENGNIKANGHYIDYKPHGEWKFYNHSGKLVKTMIYNNGKILNIKKAS